MSEFPGLAVASGEASPRTESSSQSRNGFDLRTSTASNDPKWDDFLRKQIAGHHCQSSSWARLKGRAGWDFNRLALTREGTIVGGVQTLLKSVIGLGRVAYIPRGPVFEGCDAPTVSGFFDSMDEMLRGHGVRYCAIQPAADDESVRNALQRHGFEQSHSEISPAATTILRLDREERELLAGMKAKTRYNVKIGCRSGFEFRDVGDDGIEEFHRLMTATAARQGFAAMSAQYLRAFVREFGAADCCKIFLVYAGSEAVAGQLAVGFGDTLYYKRGGWSGTHGRKHPNEFMHWSAMGWAKANGYKYYDFEGIERSAAIGVQTKKKVNASSVTRFKLGFGGDVRILPSTFETIRPKALFRAYRGLLPVVQRLGLVDRAVRLMRRV